ncbi:odorant-binding protein 59a [Bactrocera neohumeralis]|uniref:odorant-binding protein 59a n=1 Tax=Bactrocera neohumeralis TaxID=98809 RepID=UPI00216603F6|nr:odorant-binding protein 59a [Bactrocera neohumeralis]
MSKRSLACLSFVPFWITLFLLYCSMCYALKCRTDDGPSESELKRITRNCMRKIGESVHPIGGGSMGSNNNHNHPYGPLHQSNFGPQHGGNSRYDYNYDYDDNADQYYGNANNPNNNNYNNNNYNNNNGNHDRDRNVLQQRNRDRQQTNRSDNNRSASSASSNNNGGRYDNNNDGNGNRGGGGGNGDGGNRNGNGGTSSGGRNSGGNGGNGNSQRGFNQNNSNNNNNGNNRNGKNDTADVACVVHCFFDELNMLNSDDYPDRYKVQYGLTRDLRDRELRNFYTDTIQDCFQYLESQRRRDKCHYSRDLINCMTEYAKVNCDDWQEFNVVFN